MSENAITLVELAIDADAAAARAPELRSWLLATGIVIPNPARDALWQPSEFMPGPRVFDVAPDAYQFLPDRPGGARLANSGVDVIAERKVHHPIENYEPPPCPNCGTPLDEEAHHGLLDGWLAGPEPVVECPNCGQASPIGDWIHDFTFYIGNLAVEFNNWTPLTDAFVAELGSRMGNRTRIVFQHS